MPEPESQEGIPVADPPGVPTVTCRRDPGTQPGVQHTGSWHREEARIPQDAAKPMVPGYEVLGLLGRGGMGVVYQARQTSLKRVVALKMVLGGSDAGPQELARFRAEAEAVARLQHPNLVQIYEVGEHDGLPFFSLEYVDGGTLTRRLAGTPQPPREAAALVQTLARAVHAAHRRGVVHRDLKPANVLLTADGIPKVADFGLAKRLDVDSGQTHSGQVMGTPSYMAPEQAAGHTQEVGPAADVYALGAILYECLTGRPPFKGASVLETLEQVRSQDPVPPRQLQPKTPRDLETICLKCLHKEPRKRYPSAEDLAEDLGRFLAGLPVQARPTPLPERLLKGARRRPALAALAVTILAALGTVFTLFGYYTGRLKEKVAEADESRSKAEVRLAQMIRSRYALQLSLVASVHEHDADNGVRLLEDPDRCPPELRDFTWGFFRRLCGRRECRRSWTAFTAGGGVLALSPDGRTLATANTEGTVKVWDAATGKELRALPVGALGVHCLALAPDGKTLVAGGSTVPKGGRVTWWDTAAGKELLSAGQPGPVHALAFSLDGRTLASAGAEGTVKLWDGVGPRERTSFTVPGGEFRRAAFSLDLGTLALIRAGNTITLWDTAAGKELRSFLHSTRPQSVLSLALGPDGKTVALGTGNSNVKIWDTGTGKELAALKTPEAAPSLAFAPDGGTLAVGGHNGTLTLFDTATFRERGTLVRKHPTGVKAMAYSADGRTLATLSHEGVVRLWDADTDLAWATLAAVGGDASVAAAPEGNRLAVADRDGALKLLNATTLREVIVLRQGDATGVSSLAFATGGGVLAAGLGDGSVVLWEAETGKEVISFQARPDTIRRLALAPNGSFVASAGEDRAVKLHEATTGRERGTFTLGPARGLLSLAFTPDGRVLAAGGIDALAVWDTATARSLLTYWPEKKGDEQIEFGALAFSPDGKRLALAQDAAVKLWEFPGGRELLTLGGHAGAVFALAFSPDGRTLASAGDDRTVRLWDPVTGEERATLRGHAKSVAALTFADGGQVLISGDLGGTVKLWRAAPWQDPAGASLEPRETPP